MTDLCIHFANIFYLASFLNRDMLWLRLLTCAGLVFGIVFFTFCKTPMHGPIVWHVVFLLINFYQIRQLILSRRQTDLPPRRLAVAEVALDDLDREQLVNLMAKEINGTLDKRRDVAHSSQSDLRDDEQLFKELVLNNLSRRDLVNLLARRLWNPLRRRFRLKRRAQVATSVES